MNKQEELITTSNNLTLEDLSGKVKITKGEGVEGVYASSEEVTTGNFTLVVYLGTGELASIGTEGTNPSINKEGALECFEIANRLKANYEDQYKLWEAVRKEYIS